MMKEEKKPSDPVFPLVYYQKPLIGQENSDCTPVQIIFPSGGFGVGLPHKETPTEEGTDPNHANETQGIVASGPLNLDLDLQERKQYKVAFLVLALFNLIVTSVMFINASVVDPSKVEVRSGYLPSAFMQVSTERRNIEEVNFGFVIVILLLGMVSAVYEHVLGLSAYVLGTLLNFFLGTASLPVLLYALRYILDFGLVYVALVLRSRLTLTFLPVVYQRS